MKNFFYGFVLAGFSVSSTAAHFGDFERTNRNQFLSAESQDGFGTKNDNYVYYRFLVDAHGSFTGYFCADTRLVPGKLVNGYCYVENNGKGYKNSDYHVLRSYSLFDNTKDYRLLDISFRNVGLGRSHADYIKQHGVTIGGMDSGEFTFHCHVLEGRTQRSALGKYVPSHNTCYYELHGARAAKASELKHQNSTIEVLINYDGGSLPDGTRLGSSINAIMPINSFN